MAELWALLHFIMPTLFDSHEQFNQWFSKGYVPHPSSFQLDACVPSRQLMRDAWVVIVLHSLPGTLQSARTAPVPHLGPSCHNSPPPAPGTLARPECWDPPSAALLFPTCCDSPSATLQPPACWDPPSAGTCLLGSSLCRPLPAGILPLQPFTAVATGKPFLCNPVRSFMPGLLATVMCSLIAGVFFVRAELRGTRSMEVN